MTWALWLAASKLWEVTVSWKKLKYTYALRISSFLVKTENNNFIKEIKHVLRVFIAWWKTRQSLWEFSSRWNPRLRLGFSLIYFLEFKRIATQQCQLLTSELKLLLTIIEKRKYNKSKSQHDVYETFFSAGQTSLLQVWE